MPSRCTAAPETRRATSSKSPARSPFVRRHGRQSVAGARRRTAARRRRPRASSSPTVADGIAGADARLPAGRHRASRSTAQKITRSTNSAASLPAAGTGTSPSTRRAAAQRAQRGGQTRTIASLSAQVSGERMPRVRGRRACSSRGRAAAARRPAAARRSSPTSSARIISSAPDGALGRMMAARLARLADLLGARRAPARPPSRGCCREATKLHFEQISAVFSGVADLQEGLRGRAAAPRDGAGDAALRRRDPPLQPRPAGFLPARGRGRHGRCWSAPRRRTPRSS